MYSRQSVITYALNVFHAHHLLTSALRFLRRPPDGCLQYYTGVTGRFASFNFDSASTTSTHLPNQRYNACIRQEAGQCYAHRHLGECNKVLPLVNRLKCFNRGGRR